MLCCVMLCCAVQVEGDLLLGDMGQGLPLRTGCFDGAISISALQVGDHRDMQCECMRVC